MDIFNYKMCFVESFKYRVTPHFMFLGFHIVTTTPLFHSEHTAQSKLSSKHIKDRQIT